MVATRQTESAHVGLRVLLRARSAGKLLSLASFPMRPASWSSLTILRRATLVARGFRFGVRSGIIGAR